MTRCAGGCRGENGRRFEVTVGIASSCWRAPSETSMAPLRAPPGARKATASRHDERLPTLTSTDFTGDTGGAHPRLEPIPRVTSTTAREDVNSVEPDARIVGQHRRRVRQVEDAAPGSVSQMWLARPLLATRSR